MFRCFYEMFQIPLLFYLIHTASTSMSDPVVIERPLNRIEWGDLLLEYDHSLPPVDENNTVNISIFLNVVDVRPTSSRSARVILELHQRWMDDRLRFQGVTSVALPENIQVWHPQSYVLNAFEDILTIKSERLNPDGTIVRRERRIVDVNCASYIHAPCELIFDNFDDTEHSTVVYQLADIQWTNGTVSEITNSTTISRKWNKDSVQLHVRLRGVVAL